MFSGIGGFELGISRTYGTQDRGSQENPQGNKGQGLVSKTGKGTRSTDGQSSKHVDSNTGDGATCVGYSEIEENAIKIYEKNFPTHKNFGDAFRIVPEDIPDFDFLCGGFPCQSFSICGKRGGFEDTRGTLFFEIARVLAAKRPQLLLLENVKGLLSHDNGNTFGTILSTLSDLGYFLQWQVCDSKDFGVPQHRERVFIVGYNGKGCPPKVFPLTKGCQESEDLQQEAKGEQQGVSGEVSRETRNNERTQGGGQGSKRPCSGQLEQVGNVDTKGHNSLWGRVYDSEGISANLNAEGGGLGAKTGLYLVNEDKVRVLTPTECERLQGFPDGWTDGFSDNARKKCLGNAVTVNVIQAIMEKIKSEILYKEK
jgi:DNA (cytosine-5)-methyltransferase 1